MSSEEELRAERLRAVVDRASNGAPSKRHLSEMRDMGRVALTSLLRTSHAADSVASTTEDLVQLAGEQKRLSEEEEKLRNVMTPSTTTS